jgi:RNA polymerase sigma-70 factor (ECF subfamily)
MILWKRLASMLGARYDVTSVDETSLIRQAQQGDLEAFNRLVIAYQRQVYNLAYRLMGDQASAEDAAQDAFISAFRGLRGFRGGSFRAWLLRIVRNACYDEYRRRQRKPTTSLEDLSPFNGDATPDSIGELISHDEGPEDAAEEAELRRAIENCLNELPLDYRTVAVLVDIQGYDYRETASVIGKPLGTVKSRLARARARLRDCLQQYRELLPTAFRLEDETRK